MYFVGDVDFTPDERAWVQEAIDNLAAQTRGYVRIRVVFDLNFRDIESLKQYYGYDLLIKVDKSAPPVQDFDAEHCCLLGLTHTSQDHTNELLSWTDVFLVTDRIEDVAPLYEGGDRRVFVSVLMHEWMHALGVPHVPDAPGALMAPSLSYGAPTQLGPADYLAACQVWGCSARRMTNGRVSD